MKMLMYVSLILPALGMLSFGFADQRDTLAALNRRKAQLQESIDDIDNKISRTDSLQAAEKQRFELLRDRARDRRDTQRKQLQAIQSRLDSARTEITRLSGRIQGAQSQQSAFQTQQKYLSRRLVEQVEALEQYISRSLPWDRKQRLDRAAAVRVDLQNRQASIEEGLERLDALLQDQIEFGDEIVLENRPAQRSDGTTVNVSMLRLGNIGMVYVDDAGERYGILQHSAQGSGWTWKEQLSFTQREAVRNAVKIRESKMVPQPADVPLPIELEKKGASDEK